MFLNNDMLIARVDLNGQLRRSRVRWKLQFAVSKIQFGCLNIMAFRMCGESPAEEVAIATVLFI